MARRLELQSILENTIGNSNVYFQPPESVKLSYPCIVYERSRIRTKFANNFPYNNRNGYQITYIYRNPDDDVPEKIAGLPMCLFDRHYKADNLNHDVFVIYY